MFRSLQNVVPSHLADSKLFDFQGLLPFVVSPSNHKVWRVRRRRHRVRRMLIPRLNRRCSGNDAVQAQTDKPVRCGLGAMSASTANLTDVRIVKGACPHDCPDTCALEYHVSDGKLVDVIGFVDAQRHGRRAVHQGREVPAAYLPPDASQNTAQARWRQRRRQVHADLWDEALTTIADEVQGHHCRPRRRGDPAVQLRRQYGHAAVRSDGSPLLPRPALRSSTAPSVRAPARPASDGDAGPAPRQRH